MSKATNPDRDGNTFSIGDGASLRLYTDSHAYTILKVSPKTIHLQRDAAILMNGPTSGELDALRVHPGGFVAHVSGKQRYNYSPNPKGSIIKATLRKNGQWVQAGHSTTSPGCRVTAGRREHYDYNY